MFLILYIFFILTHFPLSEIWIRCKHLKCFLSSAVNICFFIIINIFFFRFLIFCIKLIEFFISWRKLWTDLIKKHKVIIWQFNHYFIFFNFTLFIINKLLFKISILKKSSKKVGNIKRCNNLSLFNIIKFKLF